MIYKRFIEPSIQFVRATFRQAWERELKRHPNHPLNAIIKDLKDVKAAQRARLSLYGTRLPNTPYIRHYTREQKSRLEIALERSHNVGFHRSVAFKYGTRELVAVRNNAQRALNKAKEIADNNDVHLSVDDKLIDIETPARSDQYTASDSHTVANKRPFSDEYPPSDDRIMSDRSATLDHQSAPGMHTSPDEYAPNNHSKSDDRGISDKHNVFESHSIPATHPPPDNHPVQDKPAPPVNRLISNNHLIPTRQASLLKSTVPSRYITSSNQSTPDASTDNKDTTNNNNNPAGKDTDDGSKKRGYLSFYGMGFWGLLAITIVTIPTYEEIHDVHEYLMTAEARYAAREQQLQSPQYANDELMRDALIELRWELMRMSQGTGRTGEDVIDMVSLDVDDIERHSHSSWSTTNSPVKPVAVIYPASTEDVVAIAKVCTKYQIPMVPYGAGSSVEGSFSAPHSGFTIDFSRMDKILEIHDEDMDVVVQPGVNWMELNDKLKPLGLFLPLDPSPTALIGGMIATNCSGPNAMRYGTMKDWVLNVTLVLADGTVLKTRRRPRKSSAGYDLTRLIVGAEGTLGFVTEATLKLAIVPPATGVATCSFKDIKTAAGAAVRMVREGIGGLAALEFMDEAQMKIINKNGGTVSKDGKSRRLWKEEPTLFIKFSGTDKTMADDVNRVKAITKEFGGFTLEVARNEQEKTAIWMARKEALWAMLAQRDEGTEIWSTDVAVPLSRLAEIIDISKQESSQLGLFNSVLGHVGDGNFHQSVMYHPTNPEEKAKVAECVQKMMVRALEMEGTVSGEHAIGTGKKGSLEREVGLESLDFMRRLKYSVDPLWLMNPGKVFDYRRLPSMGQEEKPHKATKNLTSWDRLGELWHSDQSLK